ncbi:MAG: hypothetical protein L6V93_10690 [Clostridiales bacterium]|nr:MAG: hypothetical protein L6V93_10690 [Clostridiales bacterium]
MPSFAVGVISSVSAFSASTVYVNLPSSSATSFSVYIKRRKSGRNTDIFGICSCACDCRNFWGFFARRRAVA